MLPRTCPLKVLERWVLPLWRTHRSVITCLKVIMQKNFTTLCRENKIYGLKRPKSGVTLLLRSSLETSVCVYSRSMTSSFQSQTAPSDSIPAEVLTEAVAEVNLEHTCDHVGLCYPAVSTSCLIYGPRLAAVRYVSSPTYRISGNWHQLKVPYTSLSRLIFFMTVRASRCACFCTKWYNDTTIAFYSLVLGRCVELMMVHAEVGVMDAKSLYPIKDLHVCSNNNCNHDPSLTSTKAGLLRRLASPEFRPTKLHLKTPQRRPHLFFPRLRERRRIFWHQSL